MKVGMIDLKQRYIEEKSALNKSFNDVLKKGHLILTKEVDDFEKAVCNYTGKKYCVSFNSCTDAIMIALWALGVKKGDEVITTPISFIATTAAITHIGAIPVYVDVDEDLNLDSNLIESKINKKTKAIIPVHWTGRIANMTKIKKIGSKYKIPIIEDSAQAMGSFYKNKHAGNFSAVSAFSAHPLKNLNGVGDGGFFVTDSKEIYLKSRIYRTHGLESRDNCVFYGVNSRLDVIHAKILTFRLKKLKSIIKRRRENVNFYRKNILSDKIILPVCKPYEYNSFTLFVTLCEKRDLLQKYLKTKGIESLIYYGTPLHLHKAAKRFGYKEGDFPIAEKLTKQVLSLPHHQHLNKNQLKYVCDSVNNFYSS